MRVLVCGGRTFGDHPNGDPDKKNKDRLDRDKFNLHMDALADEFSKFFDLEENWLPTDLTIISGKAKGADTLACIWAVNNYAQLVEFPAKWHIYGKSAGFRRNTQMLEEGKPDLVIAFPGGRGTAMMCKIAEDAGVEVRRIK